MVESKQAMRRMVERRRAAQREPADLGPALEALIARASTVASYLPMRTEPGIAPQPGWLLPVLLDDDELDWAAYDGSLTDGRRGLREPTGTRLGVNALSRCDLILVPALLVDRVGHRLGKGGGSYDRALARTTGFTVALLHDGELVDAVPSEPHDVPVRAAATPTTGVVVLPVKI